MHNPTKEFFNRHSRIALQISGGKDSMACLYLLEEYWDRMYVVWVNTGVAYPEVIEAMRELSTKLPHFVMIQSDMLGWAEHWGFPVDILPINSSPYLGIPANNGKMKLQPFSACCSANLWQPMAEWVQQNEITGVIRGQRAEEKYKSSVINGDVIDGVEYFLPIEHWTTEEVYDFLGDRLPDSYKRGLLSSLDCMYCTAYVHEHQNHVKELELIHPPAVKKIREVYSFLYEECMATLDFLEHYHG